MIKKTMLVLLRVFALPVMILWLISLLIAAYPLLARGWVPEVLEDEYRST